MYSIEPGAKAFFPKNVPKSPTYQHLKNCQLELPFSTCACVYKLRRMFVHLCYRVYNVDTNFLVKKHFTLNFQKL